MPETYMHLLIPEDFNFVPKAAQVRSFLSAMSDRGVVPRPATIRLKKPSGRNFMLMNPISRKTEERPVYDHLNFERLVDLEPAIDQLPDYFVYLSGMGRPTPPVLPLEFDKDYELSITCAVSSTLRSTSFIHEWLHSKIKVPTFATAIVHPEKEAFFTNPNDSTIFQRKSGGCAHFWIEFQPGKFLFPKFEADAVDVLNSEIFQDAMNSFGTAFVQGCCWE